MGKRNDGDEQPRKKKHRGRRLLFWTTVGLAAAAVAQELKKPVEERSWTGKVGGFVPYDLRWPPTMERFQQAVWNPESDELITPHAFGVGWSINFAKVVRIGQEAVEAGRR